MGEWTDGDRQTGRLMYLGGQLGRQKDRQMERCVTRQTAGWSFCPHCRLVKYHDVSDPIPHFMYLVCRNDAGVGNYFFDKEAYF